MKGLLAAALLCCLAAEAPALEITSAVKPAAGGKGVEVEVSPFDRDPVERQDNRDGRMHTFYLLLEKAGH